MVSKELKMDTIIEVHDFEELKRAELMDSKLIGINNRNLKTFNTDLSTTVSLAKSIQSNDKLLISESGFHCKEHLTEIYKETAISIFLIGELLMKSDNLSSEIKNLLN